jgi:predicted metal-dependent hydrolase
LESWYRSEVEAAAAPLVAKWEPVMGVRVSRLGVRRMKTRWGSCSFRTGAIRLNTSLGEKPPIYLEYVLVHEMVHLLEPSHGARFKTLMDRFLPEWRVRRKELKEMPGS